MNNSSSPSFDPIVCSSPQGERNDEDTTCPKILYSPHRVKAKDKKHLEELISQCIRTDGPACDLNHIDVSSVTTMDRLFQQFSRFNGDISKWDTSSVTDMCMMFAESQFTGDISQWDVSKVTNMGMMFTESHFTGDISRWNVSKVNDMRLMFAKSHFTSDISRWDVSSVMSMRFMFIRSVFNGDISNWNVSMVRDISSMFSNSVFNGDISRWNTASVTDMEGTFAYSLFNGDISRWNTSNVENMSGMFVESQFNGDISQWDLRSLRREFFDSIPFKYCHDSPLGYIGVLRNKYEFPKEDVRAARFHELRSLCEGLNMDEVRAAQFIYQQLHVLGIEISVQEFNDTSTSVFA